MTLDLFGGLDDEPDFSRMTRSQREARVERLVTEAHEILDRAIEQHADGRQIVATCVLYSGGNDSTVLSHIFKARATHAIHCNTTIGIEQTRQFVRDTCKEWGLPLLEEYPPATYRDLVIEQGFPGPGHHFKMYQRLKERGLRQARKRLVSDSRTERVVFIAGRRRAESQRRMSIPENEREGSIIWASPLVRWHKPDMNTYRLMQGDVPVNEVSDLLHMSGECLCGAFAKAGELEEIREWFPEVAAEIDQLMVDVAEAGHGPTFSTWGHRQGRPSSSGALCSSCQLSFEGMAP